MLIYGLYGNLCNTVYVFGIGQVNSQGFVFQTQFCSLMSIENCLLSIKLLCGVVVITIAQLHSTKPELRFCAGSNLLAACQRSEMVSISDNGPGGYNSKYNSTQISARYYMFYTNLPVMCFHL